MAENLSPQKSRAISGGWNREKTLMLAQTALLIAIMWVFHFTGITSIAIGPVNLTIMWVPIIIGAITLGPVAGAILGANFGISVLLNMGVITQILLGVNAPLYIFYTVVIRGMLVGFTSGILFKVFARIDKKGVWSFEATGLLTSMLNTFVFLAGIALIFGGSAELFTWGPLVEAETTRGAVFTTLFGLVIMQAIIEAGICTLVAAIVARALKTYLNKSSI